MADSEWVRKMVEKMMAILFPARLKRCPMDDLFDDTVDSWIFFFGASGQAVVQEIDEPRFWDAFRRLVPTLKEWPAPREVLDRLPSRPVQKQIESLPPVTEEKIRDDLRRFQELSKSLCGHVNAGVVTNEKQRAEGNAREKL